MEPTVYGSVITQHEIGIQQIMEFMNSSQLRARAQQWEKAGSREIYDTV